MPNATTYTLEWTSLQRRAVTPNLSTLRHVGDQIADIVQLELLTHGSTEHLHITVTSCPDGPVFNQAIVDDYIHQLVADKAAREVTVFRFETGLTVPFHPRDEWGCAEAGSMHLRDEDLARHLSPVQVDDLVSILRDVANRYLAAVGLDCPYGVVVPSNSDYPRVHRPRGSSRLGVDTLTFSTEIQGGSKSPSIVAIAERWLDTPF
jgi:hypothetical protein